MTRLERWLTENCSRSCTIQVDRSCHFRASMTDDLTYPKCLWIILSSTPGAVIAVESRTPWMPAAEPFSQALDRALDVWYKEREDYFKEQWGTGDEPS